MFSKTSTMRIKTSLPYKIILKPCSFSEYSKLAHYHYRTGPPGPVRKAFGLYFPSLSKIDIDNAFRLIGIIIYSYPPLSSRLRNLATKNRYMKIKPLSRRASLINREISTISRVIIDPQFRSLGLAQKLIKHTLPLTQTKFVEASAIMGHLNPFFEKAGMKKFTAPPDKRRLTLINAFESVGIPITALINPTIAIELIRNLPESDRKFLWNNIERHFIAPRKSAFSSGISYELSWIIPRIASTIIHTPAYFLWENPHIQKK